MRGRRPFNPWVLVFVVVACTGEPNLPPTGVPDPGSPQKGPLVPASHTDPPPVTVGVNNLQLDLRQGLISDGLYKGVPVFFAGALAYGNSAASVLLYHTGVAGASDFAGPGLPIEIVAAGAVADHQTLTLETEAQDDQPEPTTPLGLIMARETFAYAAPPNDDFVIFKYTLFNPGHVTIAGLHIGQVHDFDLGIPIEGIVQYDVGADLARYTTPPAPLAAGHLLLSDPTTSYTGFGRFGPPPNEPTSNAGWFAFLSGGIDPGPTGPDDVRHILAHGPVSLAPGMSRVVAFAIVGGDDSTELTANAAAARAKYSALPSAPYPIISVAVSISPSFLNLYDDEDFEATFTFPNSKQARGVRANRVACGGARPDEDDVEKRGRRATIKFSTEDLDPHLQNGDPIVCGGRLTDGTLYAGTYTPVVDGDDGEDGEGD
jgi:hypothetical protein